MEPSKDWQRLHLIDESEKRDRMIWSIGCYAKCGVTSYAAVKILHPETHITAKVAHFEGQVMQAVREAQQPYLAELLDCWTEPKRFCLAMPLYPATLMHYLDWHCSLPDPTCDMLCAAEIVEGLSFLHSQNVIHMDIKPENVMIDLQGHVVLCDFGLSMCIPGPEDNQDIESLGTEGYMAPELMERQEGAYDLPADIWSLGVTLLELALKEDDYYFKQTDSLENIRVAVESDAFLCGVRDADLRDLLRKIIEISPAARLTIWDVKNHPYFAPIHWDVLRNKGYPPPATNPEDPAWLVRRYLQLVDPDTESEQGTSGPAHPSQHENLVLAG